MRQCVECGARPAEDDLCGECIQHHRTASNVERALSNAERAFRDARRDHENRKRDLVGVLSDLDEEEEP